MSEEKEVVYTTAQPVDAELVKQHLANKGIEAFILNKQDSSIHFGEIELLVSKDKVTDAKIIIESLNEDQ